MCLHDWIDSLEWLKGSSSDFRKIVTGRGNVGSPDPISPLLSYLRHIVEVVDQHIAAGLERRDLAGRVDEITLAFESRSPAPVSSLGEVRTPSPDWVDRQVMMGLQRAYDELLPASSAPLVEK